MNSGDQGIDEQLLPVVAAAPVRPAAAAWEHQPSPSRRRLERAAERALCPCRLESCSRVCARKGWNDGLLLLAVPHPLGQPVAAPRPAVGAGRGERPLARDGPQQQPRRQHLCVAPAQDAGAEAGRGARRPAGLSSGAAAPSATARRVGLPLQGGDPRPTSLAALPPSPPSPPPPLAFHRRSRLAQRCRVTAWATRRTTPAS